MLSMIGTIILAFIGICLVCAVGWVIVHLIRVLFGWESWEDDAEYKYAHYSEDDY